MREIDRTNSDQPLRVLVVTGETSGDHHVAEVIRCLRERIEGEGAGESGASPRLEVYGMGGSRCRAQGMETIVDSEHSASVMGLTEVLSSIRGLVAALKTLVRECDRRRPAVAVLLDFPDFNLRLAKRLAKRKIPVLYFVTPQVWAWRTSRVKTIARYVTKAAPIFPFEEAFLQQHGVAAEYVGHPFLDRPPLQSDRVRFFRSIGLDPDRPTVALLPGSRKNEIQQLLEPMLDGFLRLRARRPGLQAVIPIAESLPPGLVQEIAAGVPDVAAIPGVAREALEYSRVGMIASGTATVEAALAGLPGVVAYRLSPITYRAARLLVRGVKHIAMPNLIARKKIYEELIQERVTGEELAEAVESILGDPSRERTMREQLRQVRVRLEQGRPPGRSCAERVTELILELARGTAPEDAEESKARRLAARAVHGRARA